MLLMELCPSGMDVPCLTSTSFHGSCLLCLETLSRVPQVEARGPNVVLFDPPKISEFSWLDINDCKTAGNQLQLILILEICPKVFTLIFCIYLTRKVSLEQIIIYNDGLPGNKVLNCLVRSGIRSRYLSVIGPTL